MEEDRVGPHDSLETTLAITPSAKTAFRAITSHDEFGRKCTLP